MQMAITILAILCVIFLACWLWEAHFHERDIVAARAQNLNRIVILQGVLKAWAKERSKYLASPSPAAAVLGDSRFALATPIDEVEYEERLKLGKGRREMADRIVAGMMQSCRPTETNPD